MTVDITNLAANDSELVLQTAGFPDLSLTGWTVDGNGNEFELMAMADDTATWGAPQPIDVTVQRWMADGAITSTQGNDDRTLTFNVRVRAATSADLAAREQALALRSQASASPGSTSFLKWTSPEGVLDAPATVFEVWTWHLTHTLSFDDELTLTRTYAVEAIAKPWVRSENVTTIAGVVVPGSPTNTEIDACTSTTHWSAAGTLSLVGSTAVRGTQLSQPAHTACTASLERSALVSSLGSTPFLAIDMSVYPVHGSVNGIAVSIDGASLMKVAQIGSVSYFQIPSGTTSFTNLLVVASVFTATSGSPYVQIADVSATDTIGGVGSRRQLTQTLTPGGSVKTSGSLHIASPSSTALGTVLVHTCADDGSGFTPPMRQYRASGNTVTTDSSCVSGSHEAFTNSGTGLSSGTIVYNIPAGQLAEGQYTVLGRWIFAAAANMTVTFTAGPVSVNSPSITGLVSLPLGTNVPVWGVVGSIALPGSKVPAESTQATVISISGACDAAVAVTLDELYLCNVTTGELSLVYGGPTPAFTHLWLDAPDYDPVRNRPSAYIGTQSDRSDAVYPIQNGIINPYVMSFGDGHPLDPVAVRMLVVTDNVDNAQTSASFYHRWHTNAGD